MKWEAKAIVHKKQKRIAVYIENLPELHSRIKKFPGALWSTTLNVWHIPDNQENRERFKLPAEISVRPEVKDKQEKFRRWMLSRRYSDNTIKTYTEALHSFLKFHYLKAVEEITNDDVIAFDNAFILKKNLSASYQNQVVSAIKLFFFKIENKQLEIGLVHRPKRTKELPHVLSKEEIKLILSAHSNIKHRDVISNL